MNSKFKINKILNLQNIFLYIGLASGGMALPTYMSTIMGLDAWLVFVLFFCVCIIFAKKSNSNLTNSFLLYISTLFVALCLVVISSTLSLGSSLSCIIPLVTVYAAYVVSPSTVFQRYLKIMFVISLISLVIFIPQFSLGIGIFRPIFSYMFPYYSSGDIYSYGGFLYRFVFLHETRNCGPFCEPGQFQCVLCVAIYLSLFMKNTGLNDKKRLIYSIVFIATLITTQSTSGYIALAAIIVSFIFTKRKFTGKYQVIFLFSIALMIFVFTVSGMWNSFVRVTITEKLLTETNNLSLSEGTGGARTQSIEGVIKYIYENPMSLWGIGYDKLDVLGIEGCAGLLSILLAIGIVPFSILWGFPIAKKIKYNTSVVDVCLSIFIVINMGLGQPHILNTSLFLMLFYGWFNKNNMRKLCVLSN